ncbi:hypothetical protein F4604DRAFT_1922509 [Suillus subluteus]|nr:hypothetical protein F4604DRAFT_1922509 [Suillus subluteus]
MPRREEGQIFHDQLNRVSRELATSKADSSFAWYPLENQSSHKLWDEEIAYLAGSLFGTGSDTTAVAIMAILRDPVFTPTRSRKMAHQQRQNSSRHQVPFIWLWTQKLPRASFEIAQDPQNPIDETGFVDSVILHPKSFNARFQPGFEDEALLRDAMAQCGVGL